MSKRAARFVRDWIEDNIHADEHQKSDPKAIVLLALRCIDDAARKGISVRDLHKTFGNLIEYMTQAIEKEKARDSRTSLADSPDVRLRK